ncbi:MAG: extracellular solute-binding protein [Rickettsiales bacterium]|nr:extracellular solute-binding protein [Rickettsiales bacterium]
MFFFALPAYSEDCFEGYYCGNALKLFGKPTFETNLKKFKYVNPDAPKGGAVKYAAIGTYDSLNGYILKGISATGLGLIYDNLMVSNSDEIFTRYPLIAERVMVAKDKKSMIFVLNKKAKWHDGKSITADDLIFTFDTLLNKGNPFYKSYYSDVESVEKLDKRIVKFNFKRDNNRELPFILSELPVLPKHYWKDREFDKTTLEAPLGSGPYKIAKVDVGKTIEYERFEEYWGADLPVNIGRYNFDKITYEYYRDETVAVEALKAGAYDMRQENIARIWANSYNIPQLESGEFVKEEIPHKLPTGMQCFAMNLRKDKFADVRVRKALELAFDFEWTNKTIFYSSYTRSRSYFSNSIYEATSLPEGKELEILLPFKDKIPENIFTEEYNPPVTDGTGRNRVNLMKARSLLEEAGWKINQGKLMNEKGEAFEIEFLTNSSTFDRIIEPYGQNLRKLGIIAKTKFVDPSQYQRRLDDFDFDMVVTTLGGSSVPGNELVDMFHSSMVNVEGSGNIMGIKNPVVDSIIDTIITAKDKETLIYGASALDRVLQHNYYVVPHWNLPAFRLVYWNKFGKPDKTPKYGLATDTWWLDEKSNAKWLIKKESK